LNAQTSRIDLRTVRSVAQIVRAAIGIYAGAPLMFLFLAALILIPYEVVVMIVTNTKHVPAATELLLTLAEVAIVNPFIAAMQMQVLLDLGEGQRPALASVVRRGSKVLAVVAAADIIAELVTVAGLSLFIVPGILAAIRLAVVAPAAAAEQTAWPDALRRSYKLTLGNGWRVLGLLVVQAAVTYTVALVLASDVLGVEIAGAVIAIVAQSFCSLLISLLYFDLRAREATGVASL
jgi:hypothetical protein